MSVKLIAIGNRLMGDEGIAVKIAETLSEALKDTGIDIILGETDIDFCISSIQKDDYLLVLDATCWGIKPGTITIIPINKYNYNFTHYITQHDLTMIKLLNSSGINVFGYVIGIEVDTIDFNLNLSEALEHEYCNICSKVKRLINILKSNPGMYEFSILLSEH